MGLDSTQRHRPPPPPAGMSCGAPNGQAEVRRRLAKEGVLRLPCSCPPHSSPHDLHLCIASAGRGAWRGEVKSHLVPVLPAHLRPISACREAQRSLALRLPGACMATASECAPPCSTQPLGAGVRRRLLCVSNGGGRSERLSGWSGPPLRSSRARRGARASATAKGDRESVDWDPSLIACR